MQRQTPPYRRRVGVLRAHVSSTSRSVRASPASASSERLAWEEKATSYSTGMFRAVQEEACQLLCTVEGTLPKGFVGTYFRNGPNARYPAEPGEPFHYFDGDGMVASFCINEDGNVYFSHTWVRTERFLSDANSGRSLYDFGSLSVGKTVGHLVLNEDGDRMGKANTSLLLHHRRLYALEDADLPYRLHPISLDTLGRSRFETVGLVAGDSEQRVFTAHPKVCPSTGELIGYGCEYTPVDQIWVYRLLSEDGKILRQFDIPLRHTSYNHDCAATRNFSVVYDGNLVLSWGNVLGNRKDVNDNEIWKFRRDIPGRIGIFPRYARNKSEVQWFDVDPFCVSHTACAWEEEEDKTGHTVIVIVTNNIGHESFAPEFPKNTPRDPDANLHMYRVNLGTGTVEERALMRLRSDFPTTNVAWNRKEMGVTPRFVYAALLDYEEPNHAPQLYGAYKYDLVTRECRKELWGDNCYGGEPFFAPRTNPRSEDDGYVLVLVNDAEKRRTELRILDALEFGSPNGSALLATIVCPRRVIPMGTHGLWLDKKSVDAAASEL